MGKGETHLKRGKEKANRFGLLLLLLLLCVCMRACVIVCCNRYNSFDLVHITFTELASHKTFGTNNYRNNNNNNHNNHSYTGLKGERIDLRVVCLRLCVCVGDNIKRVVHK